MLEPIIRYSSITLIAFMLWLYAEGATRQQENVSIIVNLTQPRGQQLLIDPPTHSVKLSVRCASSQKEQVQKLADSPINIEVTDLPSVLDQSIIFNDYLAVHERITRLGLTIDRIEPPTAQVRIERIESRSIPIEVVTPSGLELAGPATFKPESAEMLLPVSSVSGIENFKLQARLDANALAGVVPGVSTDREIDLTLPPGMAISPHVSFAPRKVKVSFTVKKKEDELVVGLVPVLLAIAPNLAKQYAIDVDQESLLLREVKVKGPSDVIASIKANTLKLEALLTLSAEDLENKLPSKRPEMRLPPGVTVESTLPLIKLTITKREGT